MTKEIYRLARIILLVIFLILFTLIGYRLSENGRYRQYDEQKDVAVWGNQSSKSTPNQFAFDTRTGKRIRVTP